MNAPSPRGEPPHRLDASVRRFAFHLLIPGPHRVSKCTESPDPCKASNSVKKCQPHLRNHAKNADRIGPTLHRSPVQTRFVKRLFRCQRAKINSARTSPADRVKIESGVRSVSSQSCAADDPPVPKQLHHPATRPAFRNSRVIVTRPSLRPGRAGRPFREDRRKESATGTDRQLNPCPRRAARVPRRAEGEPSRADGEPRCAEDEPRRADGEPRRAEDEPRRPEGEPRRSERGRRLSDRVPHRAENVPRRAEREARRSERGLCQTPCAPAGRVNWFALHSDGCIAVRFGEMGAIRTGTGASPSDPPSLRHHNQGFRQCASLATEVSIWALKVSIISIAFFEYSS